MIRHSFRKAATFFFLIGVLFACSRSAHATVESMTYLKQYLPGHKVMVFRGKEASIEIAGTFVDTATKAEVHTIGGSLISSISAQLVNRSSSHVTVDFTFPNSADLGTYEIWLRYTVEVAGPDIFKVRLFNHGKINSITASAFPLKIGETCTFTISGDHLSNAKYDARNTSSFFSGLQVTEQSDSVIKLKMSFVKTGPFTIAANQFYDKDLAEDPIDLGSSTTCYEGQGFSSTVDINPIPQPGVVTTSAHDGDIVEIRGQNLKPAGYKVGVQFRKPGATTFKAATSDAPGNQSQIGFTFSSEMDKAVLRLRYVNSVTQEVERVFDVPGTVTLIK